MERMNAWEKYPEGKKRNDVFDFAEEYRKFIVRLQDRARMYHLFCTEEQRRQDS